MYENDHLEISKKWILKIISENIINNEVKAVIESTDFGRSTTKPYTYSYDRWLIIKERGWLDD